MDSYLSPFIFGVVGHRDALLDDIRLEEKVIGIFKDFFEKYPHTPIILMSALAEGADRFIAKIALEFNSDKKNNPTENKIQLYVPLPMPLTEYRKDFQSEESLQEFDYLLEKADIYYELPLADGISIIGLSDKEKRDNQYQELGFYVTKHCRILIALWDGEDSNKIGGTSEIIRFKLEGLPDKYDKNVNFLELEEFGPVYHIRTPRLSNKAISNPYELQILYPSEFNDDEWDKYSKKIYQNTDLFNEDIKKYYHKKIKNIFKSQADLLKIPEPLDNITKSNFDAKVLSLSPQEKAILKKYSIADVLATKFRFTKFIINKLFFIGILISLLCFELYAHYFSQFEEIKPTHLIPFILFILILVVINLVYLIQVKPKRMDVKHQEYRVIAEAFRIQFYLNYVNIDGNVSDHLLIFHKYDLNWIKEVIKSSILIPCDMIYQKTIDWKILNKKVDFVKKVFVDDQLDYFEQKTYIKSRTKFKLVTLAKYIYLIAFVFAFVVLIFNIYRLYNLDIKEFNHVALIILIVLMTSSASIEAYLDKIGINSEINLYHKVKPLLKRGKEMLISLVNLPDDKRKYEKSCKIIKEIGRELLRENSIWLFINKDATPPK